MIATHFNMQLVVITIITISRVQVNGSRMLKRVVQVIGCAVPILSDTPVHHSSWSVINPSSICISTDSPVIIYHYKNPVYA